MPCHVISRRSQDSAQSVWKPPILTHPCFDDAGDLGTDFTGVAGYNGTGKNILQSHRSDGGLRGFMQFAAIAEMAFGAGRGLNSLCYVTVGTGIGAGVVIEGRPLHGMLHPEMGHMVVRRHPRDQKFAGICPFHRDCLEGLACGPAIKARWGSAISELEPSDEARSIIGFYLGQLTANVALMLSCQRVIFGGGVMSDGSMLPWIRGHARAFLNGYLPSPRVRDRLDDYVVAPGLGELHWRMF